MHLLLSLLFGVPAPRSKKKPQRHKVANGKHPANLGKIFSEIRNNHIFVHLKQKIPTTQWPLTLKVYIARTVLELNL